MNASKDLAFTVEHVRIWKEATDASAAQDF